MFRIRKINFKETFQEEVFHDSIDNLLTSQPEKVGPSFDTHAKTIAEIQLNTSKTVGQFINIEETLKESSTEAEQHLGKAIPRTHVQSTQLGAKVPHLEGVMYNNKKVISAKEV